MMLLGTLGTLLALGSVVSTLSHADDSKPSSVSAKSADSYVKFEKEVKARFPNATIEELNSRLSGTAPVPEACINKQLGTPKSSKSDHKKRVVTEEKDDGEGKYRSSTCFRQLSTQIFPDCPWTDATWTIYNLYNDAGNRLGEDITNANVPPRTIQTITGNLIHNLRTSSQLPYVRNKYSRAFVIVDPVLRAEFQIEFQAWPKGSSGIGEGVRDLLNDGYGGRYFASLVDYALEDIVTGKANAVRWYTNRKNPKGRLGRITVSGFSEREIRSNKSHYMPFASALYPDDDD